MVYGPGRLRFKLDPITNIFDQNSSLKNSGINAWSRPSSNLGKGMADKVLGATGTGGGGGVCNVSRGASKQ